MKSNKLGRGIWLSLTLVAIWASFACAQLRLFPVTDERKAAKYQFMEEKQMDSIGMEEMWILRCLVKGRSLPFDELFNFMIYKAIHELEEKQEPIDLITVKNRLDEQGHKDVGNRLMEIMEHLK